MAKTGGKWSQIINCRSITARYRLEPERFVAVSATIGSLAQPTITD